MSEKILELENKKAKHYYGKLFDCNSHCERCEELNINDYDIDLLKDDHKKYYKYIKKGKKLNSHDINSLKYEYKGVKLSFRLINNELEIIFLNQCYTYIF